MPLPRLSKRGAMSSRPAWASTCYQRKTTTQLKTRQTRLGVQLSGRALAWYVRWSLRFNSQVGPGRLIYSNIILPTYDSQSSQRPRRGHYYTTSCKNKEIKEELWVQGWFGEFSGLALLVFLLPFVEVQTS